MEEAGFSVQVRLRPKASDLGWKLTRDYAQWDRDTRHGLDVTECTLYWYEEAYDNDLTGELVADVSIALVDQGDLIAQLTKKKTKKGIKRYESFVAQNKRTMSSVNVPVRLTDTQKQNNLQLVQTVRVNKWLLPAKKKKTNKGLSKLMSNMVVSKDSVASSATPSPHKGFRSVKQVVDLKTAVHQLNSGVNTSLAPGYTQVYPKLNPWVPNQGT